MTAIFTRRTALRVLGVMAVLVWLAGCTDKNVINKAKYKGQTITNTCQDFQKDAAAIIEANTGNTSLKVAENDNAEFSYWFLEPGQFEQKGDTLYFRLANDAELYERYLQKGIAIQVKASFSSQDHLQDLEKDPSGELSMITVDEKYWKANQKPFFVYRLPVQGKVNGKQVTFQFTVVKLDKKGKVTKVFCETDKKPLGPLDSPCCTDKPWERAKPASIVQLPEVDIKDESYRYKGIVGTLDLIFPMSSTKFDRKQLSLVIKDYVSKYEAEGYKVRSISMGGYASQGGTVELNQKLSDARVQAVTDDLKKEFERTGRTDVAIEGSGRGEDWERLDLLVKTAVFSEDERNQVLAIAGGPESLDEKEAKLRKLKFWKKLVDEVLTYCRHTFITFTFDYKPDGLAYESYPTQIPIISPELYNVATQQRVIGKYRPGADVMKSLEILNNFVDVQNIKTANLYAMRSSYQYGRRDVVAAIRDIEQAQMIDKSNQQYASLTLAYKTENAYAYNIGDRMKLLNTYNDYVARYPQDKMLAYNRAVLMDRVGYISGAMAEYGNLMSSDARNAIGLNNRGVAKLKTGRFTEAEADFKDALSVNGNLSEAYYNLAIVYAYRGLTDKTVENLDRALALNPSYKAEVGQNSAFSVMRTNPKFSKYK